MCFETTHDTLPTYEPAMHPNPNNDDATLSDKLVYKSGNNSLHQTKLELHWKKILSSASDALCTNPNQPMILPPTIIQDTQQWTNVTPRVWSRCDVSPLLNILNGCRR